MEEKVKKRNSIVRNDTVNRKKRESKSTEIPHKIRESKSSDGNKTCEFQLKMEKKQKLLERAKSLSDLGRIHKGYSPIKELSTDSFDSNSSVIILL